MKGKEFEDIAFSWLLEKGYTVLKRNYRCKRGEIDIIAKKSNKIIAFEVKGNHTDLYGFPEERIDKKKLERIRLCLLEYAIANNINLEDIEIDAIVIYKDGITHIENICL
ncbi:YraN family protein [Hydrogenobaculum acidophilum]